MENKNSQNQQSKQVIPTRESETDIIKGASDTSSIPSPNDETLLHQNQTHTKRGETQNQDGNIPPSKDFDDPATRGI